MKKKINYILNIEKKNSQKRIIIIICVLSIIGLFLLHSGIFNIFNIYNGIPSLLKILDEMLPPNFSNFQEWVYPVFESISMSISATFVAALIAFPLALLAAKNTCTNLIIYYILRFFLSIFRSIPEIILGILIVVTVGFGIISGTLAITIHSIGMLGKFFSESIERSNNEITEIIVATGASKKYIISFGIIPQVLQEFIDLIMYRWEYNFRQSTILGMVGAGGIGLELITTIRLMQYDEVLALLIIIFTLVSIIDFLSSKIREYFKKH